MIRRFAALSCAGMIAACAVPQPVPVAATAPTQSGRLSPFDTGVVGEREWYDKPTTEVAPQVAAAPPVNRLAPGVENPCAIPKVVDAMVDRVNELAKKSYGAKAILYLGMNDVTTLQFDNFRHPTICHGTFLRATGVLLDASLMVSEDDVFFAPDPGSPLRTVEGKVLGHVPIEVETRNVK